jgi:enoyl-CoA hydratase/carnithine racemase
VSARRARGAAVATEVAGGVAWVTLARPATQNRLDEELMCGLTEACDAVEHDDAVRAVVLAGAGHHFCAGLPRGMGWPPASWPDAIAAVAGVGKPVVACLEGTVGGWGVALALACDIRLAATTALLRLDEVPRGRLPGGGVTQRLPRVVGPSRALAMLLLGEPVATRTALAWGLVSQVVPPSRLRAAAAAVARDLAARGPLAQRLAKEAVVRALDLPLDEGMRLEHDLYVLLQTTADRREGVQSFLERRTPRYEGR